jgi:tRNA-dihydrouridine synthase B
MGPMRGFTDHIYRNTFSEHFGGYDLAVAPFIVDVAGGKIGTKHVKGLMPEDNTGMPVVPQILSKSADRFIALANYLFDLGYETVNWNLGCPFPMVVKKKRGSGLLPHIDLITAFLDKVMAAIKGRLSIKTRLGLKVKDDIFKLIPVLNRYPLDEIIIHPRIGIQRYAGEVDLSAFEACLTEIDHPVVYNGDIRSVADINGLIKRFPGVNRWMIGRWALVDPFLAMMIKTGDGIPADRIEQMRQFHDVLFKRYQKILFGPSHIVNKMKGFWQYFSKPYEGPQNPMKKIKKARTPEQYLDLVERFFESQAIASAQRQ